MLGQVLRRLRPAAAAEVARGYSAAAKEVRRRLTETYLFVLTVEARRLCVGIRRHVNRNCVVLFVNRRLECKLGVGGLSGGDVWLRV